MIDLRRTSFALVLVLAPACANQAADHAQATDTGEPPAASSSADPLTAALERSWASAAVEPTPLATDAAFLRRVNLDLIGRVPTTAEVERFLASEAPNKREALVDALLASEDFAEHWASLWAARLLPGEKQAKRYAGEALEGYLAEALATNKAWSEVLSELLGGEGKVDERPALAYVGARKLRGENKQDAVAELASTTARVFLGARIECAQCHDHPYVSEFSREDFWAQAAYFGRTNVALDKNKNKNKNKAKNNKKGAPEPMMAEAEAAKQKKGPPKLEVRERSKGELRVALGGEANPRKEAIAPRFLGAEATSLDPELPRREQLAAAIIADTRFAEATAGWVWTQLLGSGIVEPWDDLLAARERPELLALLAADFRANDHDLRALIRAVTLSPAYQRSSAGPEREAAQIAKAEASFARARVRPLSAEQLFASLMTVTALDQVGNRAFRRAVRGKKEAALREYEFVFNDDEMGASGGFSGNVPQALLLLNGALTNEGVVARAGSKLDDILSANTDTQARLEQLWLAVYARPPRAEELEFARDAIGEGAREDWEDLMFAMIYSSEFGSNH